MQGPVERHGPVDCFGAASGADVKASPAPVSAPVLATASDAALAGKLKTIQFSVDAALLRELGERLVGKPAHALAELIKNSYDADASRVIVRIEEDSIEVVDSGEGMSLDDFRRFWMRIGTTHKQARETSPNGRRLTGSKGVGRLSVQFLADHFELTTKTADAKHELFAVVDWPEATTPGDIQQATVRYDDKRPPTTTFPDASDRGTRIVMTQLRESWDEEAIKELANQLWALQSPFGHKTNSPNSFGIDFQSHNITFEVAFRRQVGAFMDVGWYARIVGSLRKKSQHNCSALEVSVEFSGAEPLRHSFEFDSCHIEHVSFEIRVYHANQKQKRGIRAHDLRDYLDKWGGVHVYDDGFRLAYYGEKENDWLGVERDHAHRLSISAFLPKDMQAPRAMQFLPTTSRLFGAVHVSTSKERRWLSEAEVSGKRLKILITRDRLADNQAYEDLHKIVRTAIDYYASEEAKRRFREPKGPALKEKTRVLLEVLEQNRAQIPKPAYIEIKRAAVTTAQAGKAEQDVLASHMGLLGALATAGISALAYEHEVSKQLGILEGLAEQMRAFETKDKNVREFLKKLSGDTDEWLGRARATRALFSNLTDQENHEVRLRLRARPLLESIRDQVRLLIRGVPIDVSGVDENLRLPNGRYVEWSALFQNVFFNAANAMLDQPERKISVLSRRRGLAWQLLVQDTGCGVDLDLADELFDPFVRKLKVSQSRKGLIIGGMGLGLAIVRMIGQTLECRVGFTVPDEAYNTAFILSWSEGT